MTNKIRFYQVGGCVRDEIMGIPCNDIDYSVEAPSFDSMRRSIIARGGKIFLTTPQYATIRARFGTETADFVLCRKDGAYSDGRHPDTIEMGTLYDDLARRDFTMNAIAKNDEGKYIDPFGGCTDILIRMIRCVGRAEDRIKEDSLRLLRAARFSITKNMHIDAEIEKLFSDRSVLSDFDSTVSRERVREEVAKMFKSDTIASMRFFMSHSVFCNVVFGHDMWMIPSFAKK
jgi:tRNA nucleotidyltransferase (CCA-adding enzyme)